MLQNDGPLCLEDAQVKDIQNDTHPGVCAINGKRVDSVWSPWTDFQFESNLNSSITELKTGRSRNLTIPAAHGGLGNDSDTSLQVYSMLKLIKVETSWEEAISRCTEEGGILLYNLSNIQLKRLCEKMPYCERSWLGIKKPQGSNSNSKWENLREEKVVFPKSLWASLFPKTGRDRNVLMNYCPVGRLRNSYVINRNRCSICDIS